MVIIRLRGGLGNQMFQYALGKRIAKQLNTTFKIDLTTLLRIKKNLTIFKLINSVYFIKINGTWRYRFIQ